MDLALGDGPEQLPLDLSCAAGAAVDDEIVAVPALESALALLAAWPDWPAPVAILMGSAGTGKTCVANAWMRRAGAVRLCYGDLVSIGSGTPVSIGTAVLVENADIALGGDRPVATQAGLFHVINELRSRGGHLLLTSRRHPSGWPVDLADLTSRLRAATLVHLPVPDRMHLEAVLHKLLADRQIRLEQPLLELIVERMERSLVAARDIVERLDRRALAQGRAIDRRMVCETLAAR